MLTPDFLDYLSGLTRRLPAADGVIEINKPTLSNPLAFFRQTLSNNRIHSRQERDCVLSTAYSITGQRLSEESKGIAERWFVISITEALHHTKSFMSNYDQ
jgi:hypothetical protein